MLLHSANLKSTTPSAVVSPPNLLSDYYMTRFAWLSPTLLFCRAPPFTPPIWALVSGYHWCWGFLKRILNQAGVIVKKNNLCHTGYKIGN